MRPWLTCGQCLGQQFALNEGSFVLVRLLQSFRRFELAMDAAPAGACPPEEWAQGTGRKPLEKIWPKSAVTLYSHVSRVLYLNKAVH